MRALVAAIAILATLAFAASVAEAHKLPGSYAKDKTVSGVKSYWKGEGFITRGRTYGIKCKRLSAHKVRCRGSIGLEDESGCGKGSASITVRFVFSRGNTVSTRPSKSIFNPYYDLTNTDYQPESCSAF